uniref:Reverse transcriptase n=1 Tax=Cannabis sativa TaxID=3483 RepID=A0A803P8R3_CANSA
MSKDKRKKKFVGIKSDMSKAYDRLESSFLNKVLMTFKIISAFVGLKTRDPLSPYLFIIASGVLSRMLAKEEVAHRISAFVVSKSIYHKIDKPTRNFWWIGAEKKSRFLALTYCDSLCKPKYSGGLVFRKSANFNRDLLSKLGWLIAFGSDSLWVKVFQGQYFHSRTYWNASLPSDCSYVAKGIFGVTTFVRNKCDKLIGNDLSTDICVAFVNIILIQFLTSFGNVLSQWQFGSLPPKTLATSELPNILDHDAINVFFDGSFKHGVGGVGVVAVGADEIIKGLHTDVFLASSALEVEVRAGLLVVCFAQEVR